MSYQTQERDFQLWEYRVSHGPLLIPSPAESVGKANSDVIIVGLEYLDLPRFLGKISIAGASEAEIEMFEEIIVKNIKPSFDSLGHPMHESAISCGSRWFKYTRILHSYFDSPFTSELTGVMVLQLRIYRLKNRRNITQVERFC